MIVYFDASALVPLLLSEPGTSMCQRSWAQASRRVTSRISHVEVAAALATAERVGRISAATHAAALGEMAAMWEEVDLVEVDDELSTDAAILARALSLRALDAIHCASAVALDDSEFVAASGDQQLLGAWGLLGLAVLDTSRSH